MNVMCKLTLAFGSLVLVMLFALSFASATDLTGSYEGTISCSLLSTVGDPERIIYPAQAFISLEEDPVHDDSIQWYQMHYIYGSGGGSTEGRKASHLASAFNVYSDNSSNGLETGVFKAIACGTYLFGNMDNSSAYRSAEFGTGEFKVLPNGTTIIDLDYYREYVDRHFECKLNLTRTSLEDPIVTRDGPDPYS
jgi:hypothetical protein